MIFIENLIEMYQTVLRTVKLDTICRRHYQNTRQNLKERQLSNCFDHKYEIKTFLIEYNWVGC